MRADLTQSRPARLPLLTGERLASLSDTMFGDSMTLLATTLVPDIEVLKGSAADMIRTLSEPLMGVVLSHAVADIYWTSQQRRLTMTKVLHDWQTLLPLVLLFVIGLLPISTGLFVRNGAMRPR